jgi:V/A-type H+-transporting ATPase subunit I
MLGLHLVPLLTNPLDDIMTVFMFVVFIGVLHINLGWVLQGINYVKQHRKYLALSDSLIKILLLSGGTFLIFNWSFDIDAWMAPPFPILLPLIPGLSLIFLKPLGKVLGVSYLKKESYGGLMGEGSLEAFETLLSVMSNAASYIRLLALALAHIALMIAIHAMVDLTPSGGFGEIIRIGGLIFGNMVIIVLEGLLAFINDIRLHFYEFFFKFYQGNGIEYFPFYLDTDYSIITFKVEKDIVSEELEKEIDSRRLKDGVDEAISIISEKFF